MLLLASQALAEAPQLTVQSGTMPVLIVAGHGGKLPLEGAEERDPSKVDDPRFVLFGDAHTQELANDLAERLARQAGEGRRPGLVLNNIHRRYADVNRSPELTSHDPVGVAHHAAYHQAVERELSHLVQAHGWVLLLDLHGQTRYDTTLLLGTAQNAVISDWSLQTLWGPEGLVEQLRAAGFSVEPGAPDQPQRYAGGYTIRHHGLRPEVEAWQLEHSRAIRDGLDERERYLETLSQALVQAISQHPVQDS